MKKIILSLLSLLFLLETGLAGPVTPDKAKQIAESYFAAQPRTKASAPISVKLAWRLPDIRPEADLLYVFDNATTGGYVIISGEDSAMPILGFSDSEPFPAQDMPDAMRWLLDYYGSIIRLAREQNLAAVSSGEAFNPDQVVRLETAAWTQGSTYWPYNKYCPIINGVQCPTGCVATAIGIIMYYHRWPERGVGELPSYSYEYRGIQNTVPGHSLGHTYDWKAMDNNDFDQIGRLLYDIGVMVEMQYTPIASGSYCSMVTRLSQYFGYDKDIRGYERTTCDDAQWEKLIRDEIDARRPVLFGGFRSGGGHAMVIDGYSGRYFRINFGENGYAYKRGYSNPTNDGHWYTMTPIEGIERDMTAYDKGQEIFCNIKPDQGGQQREWYTSVSTRGNAGLPFDFAVGKEFVLNQFFRCEQTITTLAYALFDREGNLKEQISDKFTISATGSNGYSSQSVPCVIHKKPEAGDWISAFFEIDGKRIIPLHNRFPEFRFTARPLKEDVVVGFVTENDIDYVNGFLTRATRVGYEDDQLRYLKDYFYFHCPKDFSWEVLLQDGGDTDKIWGSEDPSDSPYNDWYVRDISPDQTVKLRCMDLTNEEGCYHLIHLSPGNYILRLKNPLTGEKISINFTV